MLLMVSIFAPAGAEPGTTVNPSISVINTTGEGIKVLVACKLDDTWLSTAPTDPVVVPAYSQRYWYTSFTMPGLAATIFAQSMFETLPDEYELDDSDSKVITPAAGPGPVGPAEFRDLAAKYKRT